jgi:glycosyltransferase involved in cell wall biosynthesis
MTANGKPAPMNITHFVESLTRGGLERMVLELVKVQQREGHHCQVVCLFETGVLARELDEIGVPVTACHKRHGLDLRALHQARRLIRAHRTEVLHTHNAVAHYQAVLSSFGLGLKYVVNTRHGLDNGKIGDRREWLYRKALWQTDVVVNVCEAAYLDVTQRGIVPTRLARVVPNGIRLEGYVPASAAMREHLLQSLALPLETRVIGSVGRLNWAKDQATMIRAFRRVHQQSPDTVLVMVGDGNRRIRLEQCAQEEGVADRVRFLGDRNDVHELLRGFDLFALSSLSEGYSIALLEACAVCLPIVATDVGGNGEIVSDGFTGRLVPPANPQAMADAMLELLNDPPRAAALGLAARAWLEQNGTLETMTARYDAIYRGEGY